MNKTKIALAAVLAMSAAGAQAGPFYVDAHLGQATADLPSITGWSLDKDDTTYSLNLGYKLNDTLAVEGGYTKLGEASYSSTTAVSGSATVSGTTATATNATFNLAAKADGFTLGLAGDFPISNAIDLSARAGVFFWDAKATGTLTAGTLVVNGTTYNTGSSLSAKDDGSDLYWGLGASYKFSKDMRAGINFTRYDISGTDIDTWTANLRYNF